MRDHGEIEELLAIRALDGLDGDDDARLDRLMAAHDDCDECRSLERGSTEVAAAMAVALEPVRVPADLEERTLARARVAAPSRPARLAAVPPAGRSRAPRSGRSTAWLRPAAAVAAAIVLFAGGWALGASTGPSGPTFPLAGARVATFGGATGADVALVYRPGQTGMVLVGSGLDRPAAGRTYELWLFAGQTPVRAGCFEPSADGALLSFVDMPVGSTRTAAVTEEPATCPSAPTSKPILTASL